MIFSYLKPVLSAIASKTFNPPIMVPLKSGQIGDIQGGGAEGGGIGSIGEGLEGGEFPEFPNTTTYGGSEFGPEPSLQGLLSQNPGLEETVPETTLPVPEFRNGGRLPDYGVGGWLGTAGSIASIIPVVGQIAGQILKTAGAVAGKFEEKAAAEKALRTQKAEAQFQAAQEAEGLEGEEQDLISPFTESSGEG